MAAKAKARWQKRGDEYRKAWRVHNSPKQDSRQAIADQMSAPEGARMLALSNGDFAIVDEADFELVSKYHWHALKRSHTTYVVSSAYSGALRRMVTTFMHRLLLDAKPGEYCDHVDHNGLNNRRSNLRRATRSQNSANRRLNRGRAFKGVSCIASINQSHPYQARIKVRGKLLTSVHFTLEEAITAYNSMALQHFGEFAMLSPVPCKTPITAT